MNNIKKIHTGDDVIEMHVDKTDAAIVERHFNKHTKLDLFIQNLAVPANPKWSNIVVRLIRYYQKQVSSKLGNRCVFDPSCSHYVELAFRKKGFFKGTALTVKRLYRCRGKNGGIDLID